MNRISQQQEWTDAEDAIFESYYGKISCQKICELNLLPGRTLSSLYNRAGRLGFKNGNRRIIHSFDEKFWAVPNHTNAFWAGVIAADGALLKPREGPTHVLSLEISVRDLDYLKSFRQAIAFSGDIKFSTKTTSFKNQKNCTSEMCYLRVSRAQVWKDDLANIWGIVPNKTFRIQPPDVPNPVLQLCFIAGYLCGDGTVTADFVKTKCPIIRFTSCTEKILQWFRDYFETYFAVRLPGTKPVVPKVCKYGNCYYYSIAGFRVAKFLEITSRLPVALMDRKWKRPDILAMMEDYKQRYPMEWSTRLPIEDEIDAYLATLSPSPPTTSATHLPQESNLSKI